MGFWFWALICVLLLTDLRYEIVNFLGGLDVTALVALCAGGNSGWFTSRR